MADRFPVIIPSPDLQLEDVPFDFDHLITAGEAEIATDGTLVYWHDRVLTPADVKLTHDGYHLLTYHDTLESIIQAARLAGWSVQRYPGREDYHVAPR